MVYRIEITAKDVDTRAAVLLRRLSSSFPQINQIVLRDVYTIEKKLLKKDVIKIANMLTNPVIQEFEILSHAADSSESIVRLPNDREDFSCAIETGFLPGVTDNIAHTVREGIEDLLGIQLSQDEGVYSSQLLLISGKLTKKDAALLAASMINPLIQRVHLKSKEEFFSSGGMDFIVPKVKLIPNNESQEIDLSVSDDELIKIGKEGIANSDGTRRGPLALDLVYMKTIQKYFAKLGRNPTDIELESIAQTWSEHCKHTIFADPIDEVKDGLYKTYIKGATQKIRYKKGKNDFCVSVFSDNSGAIAFDSKYLITHKVETHNSPSALDPYGGAITGIVGVNRDALGFGMGAKPVANFYGFCVGDPADPKPLYKDEKLSKPMLSPRRILEGVVAGVNSGGNCSGIPTPQGFVYFDKRYTGKPLVFAGTVGLIPKKANGKKLYQKKALPGDLIVMVGGRVGKDGVHGATFSSVALDAKSPATAVQIGDPITQKKFSDAIAKEARDLLLFDSITDNGAGGLSCSVAEMARESKGCTVALEKVPLKYPGLAPWEIWVSESQERMTLAVPKKNWKKFEKVMQKHGVEATVIGEFTDTGKCVVMQNKKIIMDLDLDFLHDGLPKRIQATEQRKYSFKSPKLAKKKDYTQDVVEFTKRLNLSSFDFISSQYDHEVQGVSGTKPIVGKGRVNADASVIRPVLSSQKGVVLSQALYPHYSEIDPYGMSAASIDTAIRQAVTIGADPDRLALLDNFCWCSSTEPYRLWQLKRAAQACFDTAVAYETPYISGKDSMFNDFHGFDTQGRKVQISIPPTLLISTIGLMDEITQAVSLDLKFPDDILYLLGETHDEIDASEYAVMLSEKQGEEYRGKTVPAVDTKKNKKLYSLYYSGIRQNLFASGISVGRGGLITALIRSSIAGKLGIEMSLENIRGTVSSDTSALFSESQGRILVAVDPKKQKIFEKQFKSVAVSKLGKVREDSQFLIRGMGGKNIVSTHVDILLEAYRSRFKDW